LVEKVVECEKDFEKKSPIGETMSFVQKGKNQSHNSSREDSKRGCGRNNFKGWRVDTTMVRYPFLTVIFAERMGHMK
jgi:hypothetical protein